MSKNCPRLNLQCVCGYEEFYIHTVPNAVNYIVTCAHCNRECATVDSYALNIKEEEEDSHATPTK
mgnify:CR=1 FL=1